MTKHQLCQFIVSNFVEKSKANWPREIKIAQKLVAAYPDENFWVSLPKDSKFATLAFFLTENGKNFLANGKNVLELKLPTQDNIEINKDKVGEDKEFTPSKKTLLDFIRK